MDTRPARMPLHMPPTSYFLKIAKRRHNTTIPEVAAEIVVFIATWAASWPVEVEDMPSVEPQLKPYQPNHKMNVPNTTSGVLCGSKFSSLSKRPFRGPTTMAPTRAPTPPVMCTMPLPAKSLKPTSLMCLSPPGANQPAPDQV